MEENIKEKPMRNG